MRATGYSVRRKILLGFGGLLVLVLIIVLALPLWLPWVLKPLAPKYGLSYANYQRVGYGRFVLRDAVFTNKNVRLEAGKIDGYVPTAWLWQQQTRQSRAPFLVVDEWRLETKPRPKPATPRAKTSVYTNYTRIQHILQTVNHWIPSARLRNGELQIGKRVISIPSAQLRPGLLSADCRLTNDVQANLQAKFDSEGTELVVDAPTSQLHIEAQVADSPVGLKVNGGGIWWNNQFDLTAEFDPKRNLPVQAKITATGVRVPANLLKLPGYGDLQGALNVEWKTNFFFLQADAHARTTGKQEPIELALKAAGDLDAITVESGTVVAPWLKLNIPTGTKLNFDGPLINEETVVTLALDLGKQPWAAAEGAISSKLTFTPANGRYPDGVYRITGSNLVYRGFQASNVRLTANSQWPWFNVSTGRVVLPDKSWIGFSGSYDLPSKLLQSAEAAGEGAFKTLFPDSTWGFERASLNAKCSGPIQALEHEGTLLLTNFWARNTQRFNVSADWRGVGSSLDPFHVFLAGGKSRVTMEGKIQQEASQTNIVLQQLTLDRNGQTALALKQPVTIELHRIPTTRAVGNKPLTEVIVDAFHLTGPQGNFSASGRWKWPQTGNMNLNAAGLDSALLEDFFKLPRMELNRVTGKVGWTNGPIRAAVEIAGTWHSPPGIPITLAAKLEADANVRIHELFISSSNQMICRALGHVPIRLLPGDTNGILDIDLNKPLRLRLDTEPQAFFWETLAQQTGIVLHNPRIKIDVEGVAASPQGLVNIRVDKLEYSRAKRPIPAAEQFVLDVVLKENFAAVKQLQFHVKGQPVNLTARLPMGQSVWRALVENRDIPDWKHATGELKVDNAKLAAFSMFVPEYVTPEGTVSIGMALRDGKLNGKLQIDGARTRPLAQVGTVRASEVRLLFDDKAVKLQAALALGGELLLATGNATLPPGFWRTRELPRFHLALRGQNVALSRQPEQVLRADLNVAISHTNKEKPIITGVVRLRDSMLLRDLRDFTGGKVASVAKRPPFFSISEEPLSQWQLDVRVTGDSFMQVRSPVFKGEISTDLRLQGTLKEPLALGDIRVASGSVVFPFASLEVDQGFVTLRSDDPYHPQMFITASAKTFGYDVKMQLTGTTDQPIAQFTSTPPLTSQQVLMLVTTGAVPSGPNSRSAEQRAGTLALYLGKNLLSTLGFNEQSGNRLTIRSGESMTEEGRSTYDIEYKLTEDWAVVAEYDRFNEVNVGVKWRVFSR